MKRLFLILATVIGFSSFAQDPQTNAPTIINPLLDEYIKEGFDRNYRYHTRILKRIDYMVLTDITRSSNPTEYTNEYGTTDISRIYRYYHTSLSEYRFLIAYNEVWYNNYYVLRRIFFRSIGLLYGFDECHKDCKHIMSGRRLMDPVLVFYDAVPEEWEKELDIYYKYLKEKKL